MRYRIDFTKDEPVTYRFPTTNEEMSAVIVAVNDDYHPDEMYSVRITANHGKAFQKGAIVTTSGNHLLKRTTTRKPKEKKSCAYPARFKM